MSNSDCQKLWILCGLPGSGKSTWAHKTLHSEFKVVIVSRDSFRHMFNGGEYSYNDNLEPLVRKAALATVATAIREGWNVIYDECNLTKEHRAEVTKYVKENCQYHFPLITMVEFEPSDKCLERRLIDTRGYPAGRWEEIHAEMKKIWEPVEADECYSLIKVGTDFSITKENGMSRSYDEIDKPSGAVEVRFDYCNYELGEKHKCDKYIAYNCKRNPEDCTKENCQSGFYDKEQGHCQGCVYGAYDVNIKTCDYRSTQHDRNKKGD